MAFINHPTIDILNQNGKNSMGDFLGIEFTEIGADYLIARMPVDNRTRQPYGILHGGASVVLAETVGSVGANLCVDLTKYRCVGLEINANHIKSVKEGFIYAKGTPLHTGKTTQIWEIKITNEKNELVCVSRLTVAVIGY